MSKIIPTPREPYKGGYWAYAVLSKNIYFMLFLLVVALIPTIQGTIIGGELYPLIFWFAPALGAFHNWYCWDEAKKGETS
jgi:hypothetical protein